MTTVPAPRVFVVGSINEDLIARVRRLPVPGETVLATAESRSAGGKGANQAVAAARAGARAVMVGAVGDDDPGVRLRRELVANMVDTSAVAIAKGQSTGYAAISVDDTGANTIVVVPGANSAVSADMAEAGVAAIGANDVLVVQCEIPDVAIQRVIMRARRARARTVLNLAPYRASSIACGSHPDFLIVNAEEAGQVLGHTVAMGSALEDAVEIASRYRTSCVITLGAAGSVFADTDGAHHVPAVAADVVVDTTGAGDAFVGVFAAALALGETVRSALSRASLAASLSVRLPGAQPSYPDASQIDDPNLITS
jgi:ribokinase